MCGIAGGTRTTQTYVETMLDRIRHRGPDGDGVHACGDVIHGHVRLSLVDLSTAASQPFKTPKSVIAFNGEIWNWRELKKQLKGKYQSQSDTEVLLRILDREGLPGLNRIEGMFAFSWTSPQGESFVARDRWGEIPLYVDKTAKGYLWASERKAFDPGRQPIAVRPGWAFNVDTGKWIEWATPLPHQSVTPDFIWTQLQAGVHKRLQADAPVCCLISGGLDSAAILTIAAKERPDVVAFTAYASEESEDLQSARRLCKELKVKLIETPVSLSVEGVREAIHAIEIASKAQVEIASLCIPLAAAIRKHGFKACLSGEAADELFGGYGNFQIQSWHMKPPQLRILRKKGWAKMARGNFLRCNKAFMSQGVEVRLPFMEPPLIAACMESTFEDNPRAKKALKQAARGKVPDWCIDREKQTFQHGAGSPSRIADLVADPLRFYKTELRNLFSYVPAD